MFEIAGGILLAIAILAFAPLILGLTFGAALLAKAVLPYLLATVLTIWIAHQVPSLRDAWAWGLLGSVGLGFLAVKSRDLLAVRRDSPWEWHQGHYSGFRVILFLGLPLLPYFHIKTDREIRRKAGYDDDASKL